jgi:putative colanic acid biosynthesis acetyltransferase WcaB
MSLLCLLQCLERDWRSNIFFKSKLFLLLFRLANFFALNGRVATIVGLPFIVLYIFIGEWILGIEIHPKTRIGKGLVIYHGVGVVINGYSRIGENFVIRQGCCVGNKILKDGGLSGAPVIGNNVELGVNAVVLGDVVVHDGVKIGAGAVVLTDCIEHGVYVGVPASNINRNL